MSSCVFMLGDRSMCKSHHYQFCLMMELIKLLVVIGCFPVYHPSYIEGKHSNPNFWGHKIYNIYVRRYMDEVDLNAVFALTK